VTSVDISRAALRLVAWLDRAGPASQDLHDIWAWPYGRWAKSVYYRHAVVGTALVAPMVALDLVAPGARRSLRPPSIAPIAAAHYADALLRLGRHLHRPDLIGRAIRFLETLDETATRHEGLPAWGYPFDWETCVGTFEAGTPLITTMPYVYDAYRTAAEGAVDTEMADKAAKVAESCYALFPQLQTGGEAWATAYTPFDQRRVVNASAYRAYVLRDAAPRCGRTEWESSAHHNVAFVLACQRPDGSWPYAVDGKDDFTDNIHTCFVLECLAKMATQSADDDLWIAVERGYDYYLRALLDREGLPVPFAVKPRFQTYSRDLYDYAEGINLALLVRDRIPAATEVAERLTRDLIAHWQCTDGHFRTRKTLVGWDATPYHRWAQSQTMRALSLMAAESR
jgi:hypothetical protein